MNNIINDVFTETADGINLEVDTFKTGCISSSSNKFNLDSEGNLTVKSINLELGTLQNKSICNLIYPVGSIYLSVNPANPSTLFGGTWVAWGTGKVPVGVDTSQTEFNTVEKPGGDKNLQEHFHIGIKWVDDKGISLNTGSSSNSYGMNYSNGQAGQERNILTQSSGTGKGQNLQPYITCYMWKRTS